jgi:hypothetical protein
MSNRESHRVLDRESDVETEIGLVDIIVLI